MEYEQAMEQWRQSPERRKARRRLEDTVQDLLNRGLIQYDDLTKRYDLHPVVRGIAAGGLQPEEKDSYGQRVIDHFSAKAHNPYEEAVTLEDVRDGIQIVRTLLKMGRYQDAHNAFDVDLSYALLFNLEAHSEILSLLKPFFPAGWGIMPTVIADNDAAILASTVGIALATLGELTEALSAVNAGLANRLRAKHWGGVITRLGNASWISYSQNWLARVDRCVLLGLNLAKLVGDDDDKFITLLRRFSYLAEIGEWATAQSIWESIDSMGRNWPRNIYRPGDAECQLARLHFWQGDLSEEQLAHAERVTHEGKNRYMVRTLHVLRAEWHSQKNEWALAAESLQEAVGLARAIGKPDAEAETRLALARFHMGQLSNAQSEAEQLTQVREASHHALSELWLAIGDHEQAKNYAIKAYQLAWADGEPYVHRYRLNKARSILQQLGAEIPQLPVYDPAKSEKFPWEDDLAAAIEELRAEKAAESSVDSTTSQ
jgi:tetratricopeptide (TPR) repeat protein